MACSVDTSRCSDRGVRVGAERVRAWARRKDVLDMLVCSTALLASLAPAGAITGGTEDTANSYSNVGMVVFYQPDGRFRCTGTLDRTAGRPDRRPLHVPGHRQGGRHLRPGDLAHRGGGRDRHPPRSRRHGSGRRGLRHRLHRRPTSPHRATKASRPGSSARRLTHRDYSDFTDIKNWNDTGVDHPRRSTGAPDRRRSHRRTTSTSSRSRDLNKTEFLTIGYGTEVRQAPSPARRSRPRSASRSSAGTRPRSARS